MVGSDRHTFEEIIVRLAGGEDESSLGFTEGNVGACVARRSGYRVWPSEVDPMESSEGLVHV
jgi:hypothetical protein